MMVTATKLDETPPHKPAPPGPRPHGPEKPVDTRSGPLARLYPFDSHWLNVSGDEQKPLWLHYLDEGPKDAPVVVMLHGNPTWSFMYRNLVEKLRGEYRCIVPDHMGCGLSDRPQGWSYRLEDHAENLGKLLDHLGADKVTLVMHDWGGMIGMTWAVEHPERVQAACVMNTAAFQGKLPWRIRTVRIPGFGKAAVLGFNAFVKAAVVSCTHHKEVLTDDIKAGYLAPYGSPHDRIATLKFVWDVPLDEGHPTWQLVDTVDTRLSRLEEMPLLVLWGDQDWCFTPKFRQGWQERFPKAEVTAWDDAAHFVFEDKKDLVTEKLEDFLKRHVGAGSAS